MNRYHINKFRRIERQWSSVIFVKYQSKGVTVTIAAHDDILVSH